MIAELIAKLETLSGPDRETDGLIFKAVTEPGDHWHQFDVGDDIGEQSLSPVWYRRDPDDESAYEAPPFYTESIDAALTLVPEGREWRVDRRHSKGMHPAYASIWASGARDIDFHANAHAKTPAIAICIASLRAIAALPAGQAERGEG